MIRPLITLSILAMCSLSNAAELPEVEVFKSPHCSCCTAWAEHMRSNGFTVKETKVADVPSTRGRLGMPERFGSCHTAKVGNYIVEGHVPAVDVKRLLNERPKAVGLAAPGMPQGSPGMETPNPTAYDVLLVTSNGRSEVFAHHVPSTSGKQAK